MSGRRGKYAAAFICAALFVATFGCYLQIRNHRFISFDDDVYIYDNVNVRTGLTGHNIIWAFTGSHAHNWHPMTWLSHMLDCEMFGLDAGRHHLVNVLLHAANAVLFFLLFNRMTGRLWRSAFVAAAFAIHPLHVESVAWASERKDVLSTLFWCLTILAYIRYVNRPRPVAYLLVVVTFAVGLMAKQMLVTLPFVLLLLDYWPLRRVRLKELSSADSAASRPSVSVTGCILEKIPLLVLSAVAGAIVYAVQLRTGIVKSATYYPIPWRIANGIVAYAAYIAKTIWPTHLAIFYPHVGSSLPVWQIVTAALLVGCVTVLSVLTVRRRPYLAVGWFWYLGTLVPVIGLVQLWEQARADRYTYIPSIGIFVMAAWGLPVLLANWRYKKIALAAAALSVLSGWSVCTHLQLRYWRDSETLFRHALDVTKDNYMAHYFIAHSLYEQGRLDEALAHNRKALEIKPYFVDAHNNLGVLLSLKGQIGEAVEHYEKALQINPDLPESHLNLAEALIAKGDIDGAAAHFEKALELKPDYAAALRGTAKVLLLRGNMTDALKRYEQAVQIAPNDAQAHNDLGVALSMNGQNERAVEHFRKAVELAPDSAPVHFILARSLIGTGRPQQALVELRETLLLNPSWPEPMVVLARLLMAQKEAEFYDPAEALSLAEKACGLDGYRSPKLLDTLAEAYAANARYSEAADAADKALRLAREHSENELIEGIEKRRNQYESQARSFRSSPEPND